MKRSVALFRTLAPCLLVALFCLPLKAFAQTPPSLDIATYSGADRSERLIEGAKTEGSLLLYSSLSPEEITTIGAGFEAKYGVKLQNWRGDSENIVRRAVVEARAGRHDVDIAETSGTEMEALKRENLLRELKLPVFDDLLPQAVMPHKQWVATRMIVFVAAYNTNVVKAADAPKTYDDLLDARWKGKLGIESDDANWLMTVAGALGEQKSEKLFRDIVAQNGISVRKGHTLLAQLVVSGEVPLALTTYLHRIDQYKSRGAPVEPLFLSPVVALPTGAGIMKNAPHPYAAVLFMDYLLSPEGQQILAKLDSVPTNRKVPARDGKDALPELTFVDVAKLIDQGDKWTKLYRDIFSPPR
jgi:iron(III) transport system substrate-binding protein